MRSPIRIENSLRVTRLGFFAIVFSFVLSLGLATFCIRGVNAIVVEQVAFAAQQKHEREYIRSASAFLHASSASEEAVQEPVGAVQTEDESEPLLLVPPSRGHSPIQRGDGPLSLQQELAGDAAEYALEPVSDIRASQRASIASDPGFLEFTGDDPDIQPIPYGTAVAVDPASGTYLLVWSRAYRVDPPLYDLVAQRVGEDGNLLDVEPFVIARPQHRLAASPRLIFGHGVFFLTWYWAGGSGFEDDWNGVAAARIAADGTVLDPGGFEVARWSTQAFCCQPFPNSPVVASVTDGFLLLWHHATYSGGVSGGAVLIAGTLVASSGNVGAVRSFYIMQPWLAGSFILACNKNDRCIFSGNWRGHSPLFVFDAQEYLSDAWVTPTFRGCDPSPASCSLSMVWDSGGRLDIRVLPDDSFIAAWEAIDANYGTRNGIMLQRISPTGQPIGEPTTLPDSEGYHLPRFGDSERLFFHGGNFETRPWTNRDAYRMELKIRGDEIVPASAPTPLSEQPIELYASGLYPACSSNTCFAAWEEYGVDFSRLRAWHSSRNIRPTNEELAARFAPVLIMDSEEKFLPISREDYLTVTDLKTRKVRFAGLDVIETLETDVMLEDLVQPELECPDDVFIKKVTERCTDWYYFLDVDGVEPPDQDSTETYAGIQQQLLSEDKKPTIYWHVTNYTSGELAIQYWFFYLYNDFTNRHESDWEQITLRLDENFNALEVAYASHTSPGQKKTWQQLEDGIGRQGEHVMAYVARGSHASYFDPGYHGANICKTLEIGTVMTICFSGNRDFNDGQGDVFILDLTEQDMEPTFYDKLYMLDELLSLSDSSSFVFSNGDYSSGNYIGASRTKDKSTDPRLREEWNDPLGFVERAELIGVN